MRVELARRCPVCSYRLNWEQKWRFTKWWGSRRASICPACGEVLMWATGAWRALNILAIVLVFVQFAVPWPWRSAFGLLAVAGLVAIALGLRLVRVPEIGARHGGPSGFWVGRPTRRCCRPRVRFADPVAGECQGR
jgi:hypothetical protein